MKLRILSVTGTLLEAEADSVTVPAADGQLGILRGHSPMIAALRAGEIRYGRAGTQERFPVSGGVLEVSGDLITVLTDGDGPASNGEDITQ